MADPLLPRFCLEKPMSVFPRPLIMILILLSISSFVDAEIVFIPEEYPTIQAGVDQTSPGDTVLISMGDYYENIVIAEHGIVLAGTWYLTGDTSSIAVTRLRGDSLETVRRPLRISTPLEDTVVVAGLTLCDGNTGAIQSGGGLNVQFASLAMSHVYLMSNQADEAAAAYFRYSQISLDSCLFENNQGDTHAGTIFGYHSSVTARGNRFISNSSNEHSAVFAWNAVEGTGVIQNNTIIGNSSHSIYGTMMLWGGGSWVVEGNTFRNNTANLGGALGAMSLDTLQISNNVFDSNTVTQTREGSDHLQYGDGAALALLDVQHVSIEGNSFISNSAEALAGALYLGSNATIARNRFIDNRAGNIAILATAIANGLHPNIEFIRNRCENNGRAQGSTYPSPYSSCMSSTLNGTLTIAENDFTENQAAVVTPTPFATTTAIRNYWGSPSGPFQPDANPNGGGDTLATDVPFLPFSTVAFFPPRIEVQHSVHDFGTVPPGTSDEFILRIYNRGVEVLTGTLDGLSRGPFSLVSESNFLIQGGDTLALIVRYEPRDSVRICDTLAIHSNDNEFPLLLVRLLGGALTDKVPDDPTNASPHTFRFLPSHPNPFNSISLLRIEVPFPDKLRLEVFDILGKQVKVLSDRIQPAGVLEFPFNAGDLASGVYFIRASIPNLGVRWQKLVLIR